MMESLTRPRWKQGHQGPRQHQIMLLALQKVSTRAARLAAMVLKMIPVPDCTEDRPSFPARLPPKATEKLVLPLAVSHAAY
jgi:hypothetical protein